MHDIAFPASPASRKSQVSHKGIRPICINGQGDACCLIMTDGYAQLTVIDFLVAYLASKMMGGGGGRGGGGEGGGNTQQLVNLI